MALLEAHENITKSNRERYERIINIILGNLQDDKEKIENLEHILQLLETTVKNELTINNSKEAIQTIQDQVNNNEDEDDERDINELKQEYESRKRNFNEDNLRRLLDEDDQVRRLRDIINELQGVRSNGNADGDDDEDIQATQEERSLIDPISKKMMEDPVRHLPCGHVYDKTSILAVIKQNKRKGFKCPYMGCQHRAPIQKSDLVEAKDYKREIEKRKRAANYM